MNEQRKEEMKHLTAQRIRRKTDGFYQIMIFYESGRYYQTIRCKKAKDVEKALRKYVEIYKIPVMIKYYGIERKRKKPRQISNVEYRIKK